MSSVRRVDLPSNDGGGLRCGVCLKNVKSFLRLKKHMADQHGAINEFSKGVDMSHTNRNSIRKENLKINEEKLKDEISYLRSRG